MYLNPPTVFTPEISVWLTLTWDVFKYTTLLKTQLNVNRLTLTWDVFKLIALGMN